MGVVVGSSLFASGPVSLGPFNAVSSLALAGGNCLLIVCVGVLLLTVFADWRRPVVGDGTVVTAIAGILDLVALGALLAVSVALAALGPALMMFGTLTALLGTGGATRAWFLDG